jgi:hypothetical protein
MEFATMKNLLRETEEKLSQAGKCASDVLWVGSELFGWFSWEEFSSLANREYDNGFGGQEVSGGLITVGEDWWLERGEYDGSEWWEFKTLPKKPQEHKVPMSLFDSEIS